MKPALFMKTDKRAIIPKYATPKSSGFDFHCLEDVVIQRGETKLVKTGLKVQLPPDSELQVRPRSGLALKRDYMVKNSPGTIDEDYRGEIGIVIFNPITPPPLEHRDFGEPLRFKAGDRIAQGVIMPVLRPHITEVDSLDDTERGEGGFGHSGVSQAKEKPQCCGDCKAWLFTTTRSDMNYESMETTSMAACEKFVIRTYETDGENCQLFERR